MQKFVDDIIKDVRICIDEIALNDSEFVGLQDNSEMETIIRSKIIDALRYVHGNADWSFLEPDTVFTYKTPEEPSETPEQPEETPEEPISASIEENIGKVVLPANFMRLCYAQFASWPLFLTEPIYWNDKEYATLSNAYSTGSWERPKIAMTIHNGKTLELYKAKDENDIIQVGILTEPAITIKDGKDSVFVSEKLERALIYYIAGLTLLTYNEQRADNFFNQAMVMMGVNTTKVASV